MPPLLQLPASLWWRSMTGRFCSAPASVRASGTGFCGLLDVHIGTRAPAHGPVGSHRRPLAIVSATLTLFGLIEQTSALDGLLTLPEIAWEFSLGIWLIVKGFNPSAPLLTASAT
jgi:hypothetical protein